jgi:diguanylate cyclase (GGDEF)-like protein
MSDRMARRLMTIFSARQGSSIVGENFAFFLPIMMASFGLVFALLRSWRIRAAAYWSASFFCSAGAFAAPLGTVAVPSLGWQLLSDTLFAISFLAGSQALLIRWRPDWLLSVRIAICILSITLCAVAIAFDKLQLELAASDFGCFLLAALPLIAGRKYLKQWPDRILFTASGLVALDNLVRGSTISLTFDGQGNFQDSLYAYMMQATACISGLFLAMASLSALIMDQLRRYQREALHDPLSGLLNRRGFDEAVADRAHKGTMEGSLIVCDIDHFKALNDQHGHMMGDRAICILAEILRRHAPAGAISARFGGEEFVLYLPGVNAARAASIANDIRESLARDIAPRLGLDRALTASFGLSTVQDGAGSVHDAIVRADDALYEAKARGRNRVCVRRLLTTPDGTAHLSARRKYLYS